MLLTNRVAILSILLCRIRQAHPERPPQRLPEVPRAQRQGA